jgi:hypothetical protein
MIFEAQRNGDAVSLQFVAQEEHGLLDHWINRHGCLFGRSARRHRTDSMDDVGGALHLGCSPSRQLAHFLEIRRRSVQAQLRRLGVSPNRRQWLNDLTRNSSPPP